MSARGWSVPCCYSGATLDSGLLNPVRTHALSCHNSTRSTRCLMLLCSAVLARRLIGGSIFNSTRTCNERSVFPTGNFQLLRKPGIEPLEFLIVCAPMLDNRQTTVPKTNTVVHSVQPSPTPETEICLRCWLDSSHRPISGVSQCIHGTLCAPYEGTRQKSIAKRPRQNQAGSGGSREKGDRNWMDLKQP